MSSPTSPEVQHKPGEHRYEYGSDDTRAVLDYGLNNRRMTITHTYVPGEFRGQGIAEKLVRAALADARAQKFTVVPQCSYVAKFIARHAEFQDLLD